MGKNVTIPQLSHNRFIILPDRLRKLKWEVDRLYHLLDKPDPEGPDWDNSVVIAWKNIARLHSERPTQRKVSIENILVIFHQHSEAKRRKDFREADRLRLMLNGLGVKVEEVNQEIKGLMRGERV